MTRRKPRHDVDSAEVQPKGFDDYEVKLGDAMRGERATMGKSLLDVQRELRIKAAYISAIENADASAFESPGFIAGYVRSYARYLKMDPEHAYERFCAESGFAVTRALSSADKSDAAKTSKKTSRKRATKSDALFDGAKTPFVPQQAAALPGIAPQAIGSSLVLLAVIALIAFGGWTVLKEIQKVTVAPVEQSPGISTVLSEEDSSVTGMSGDLADTDISDLNGFGRIYRPQALDVPVIVARDAPIASLDPTNVGLFAIPDLSEAKVSALELAEVIEDVVSEEAAPEPQDPIVVEEVAPTVALLATEPAWVRVRAGDGSVLFEKILSAGEEYILPNLEDAPTLRAGNSGAVYFRVGSTVYGPAGGAGGVAKNVTLSADALATAYSEVDPTQNGSVSRVLAASNGN